MTQDKLEFIDVPVSKSNRRGSSRRIPRFTLKETTFGSHTFLLNTSAFNYLDKPNFVELQVSTSKNVIRITPKHAETALSQTITDYRGCYGCTGGRALHELGVKNGFYELSENNLFVFKPKRVG